MDRQILPTPHSSEKGSKIRKSSFGVEVTRHDVEVYLNSLDTGGIRDGMRLTVGPERARQILQQYSFEGQRPIDSANVRGHAYDLQNDRFWKGSQITFAQLPDGKKILVNGYHRLHAIIATEHKIEFQVQVEPVRDYDGVRELYCSIDTNIRKRTNSEIVHAAGLADKFNVRPATLRVALAAVTVIASDLRFLFPKERPDDVLTAHGQKDNIEKWANEIRAYDDILSKSTASSNIRKSLLRQGIMAAALVTLRYQPEKAREFWTGVAVCSGLRSDDPRYTLAMSLINSHHTGRPNDGPVCVSKAWNAWCEGRHLKMIRRHEDDKCEFLGTPYAPVKRRKRSDDA